MKKLLLVGGILASVFAQAEVTEVNQGMVGAWEAGEDCSKCYYSGKTSKPIGGYCYFPVDFEQKPGKYKVGKSCGGKKTTTLIKVNQVECEEEIIDAPELQDYVVLPPKKRRLHARQQSKIYKMLRTAKGDAKFSSLPLGAPADPLPISDSFAGGNFSTCRTLNGEKRHRHTGVDYGVGEDEDIVSIADGTVSIVEDHFFAGKSVFVDHGDGLVSMYFHLNDQVVTEGQKIKQGDVVGKCGSTGRSTGSHLHLGVRWRNQRIHPHLLFPNASSITPDSIVKITSE